MLRWYVLQSKPQKESFLYDQLRLRKIETYFPRVRINPVNPRAKKVKPYFPCYLFIRVDLDEVGIANLQWMPGACRLISYDGEPAFISDVLMKSIQSRVDRINLAGEEVYQKLKPGDMVSVHSGPFAGYRAIFDSRLKGNERVRVLLQMLQDRQICMEISGEQIARIQ
jgi:transcriptional antiterminator RfaH